MLQDKCTGASVPRQHDKKANDGMEINVCTFLRGVLDGSPPTGLLYPKG